MTPPTTNPINDRPTVRLPANVHVTQLADGSNQGTAWRAVGKTRRWGLAYEKLSRRKGGKRAIVAIARRRLASCAS